MCAKPREGPLSGARLEMMKEPPPQVEVVTVRPASLPPSPGDAAFSIIRLDRTELAGAQRLDSALSQTPGVSLFRRTSSLGANPTTQGVSLRGIAGSGASRALVTLDGVPQNDPFGGWVIWTRLPALDVAQATIVRGAGAGPYGAGALTGVISLTEAEPAAGGWILEAEGGSLGLGRGAAVASLAVGGGALFIEAAGEHSDGWIPVEEGRGAADQRLTLDDRTIGLRYVRTAGEVTQAWRVSAYQEERDSGLEGAASRARGVSLSYSAARPPALGVPGWRAQTWLQVSDLANTSVSVAADRQSTSLSNNQYETPAIGYGVNAAARWQWTEATLEAGVDLRGAVGEDREAFKPVSGVLTRRRLAGGQTLVGGGYLEATRSTGPWLLAAGVRVDGWDTFDGHRLESSIFIGTSTLDLRPPSRGGALPSGRLAARFDLGGGSWLRAAGYTGFRAPTLNELFRPFRAANNITQANAALIPERIYGIEGGAGGDYRQGGWAVTVFYNRLENPVTNVTIGRGPFLDPVEGFVPAGGLLLQRQNVGAVDAYGIEAEGKIAWSSVLSTRVAIDWTHARVDGGAAAPQLDGRIPVETPAVTATAGIRWRPLSRASLSADLRYESARYDDDQNTLRLAPATTVDLRLDWRARAGVTVFVAARNLFDVNVATGETAGGVYSYGPPRMISAGIVLSGQGLR
jgi:vitamin B12 transporter